MEKGIWLQNICFTCYFYNFNIIAYQIVMHHCAQIISLNQMIWRGMLMTSKNNLLSWYKNSSRFSDRHFLSLNISNFSKKCNHNEKGHSLYFSNTLESGNPTKLSIFENLVGSSTLSKIKRVSHYEIIIISKQELNL